MRSETILVVDDSEDIRILLSRRLEAWGHHVMTACNGWEAYEILEEHDIHMVITDWRMPVCDGIALCRKIRHAKLDHYIYIILLTGRSEKDDIAEGMQAGADDFVAKPFDSGELKARIHAGQRILKLERDLREKQQSLNAANTKLEDAYKRVSEDLRYAAQLQKNLLPPDTDLSDRFRFKSVYHPSRFLAGDIFNIIPIDDDTTVGYILDVAGKGVPAALLSFTMSKLLLPLELGHGEHRSSLPMTDPASTATQLNAMFHKNEQGAQYFTMNYAVINHRTRSIRLVQAGHPPAVYLPAEGEARLLGEGGYPIGLLKPNKVSFPEILLEYKAGDRIFLYSDGATETMNANYEYFSEERLLALISENRKKSLADTLTAIKQSLLEWAGHDQLDDDLTICALELY